MAEQISFSKVEELKNASHSLQDRRAVTGTIQTEAAARRRVWGFLLSAWD
jgi:hypothetical protein